MSAPIPPLTDRDLLDKGAVALTFGEAVGLPLALRPKSFYGVRPDSPVLERYDPLIDSVLPNSFEARALQERMSGTDPLTQAEREHRQEEQRQEEQAIMSATQERYRQVMAYLDQQIALTERDLEKMRQGLAEIEARRAELAPLIAAQRQVVEAAQQAYDQQKAIVTGQESVVREQRATVDTLKAQLPAKQDAVETATATEQAAKVELDQAKQTTQEKTELKTLTEQDVQTAQKKYEAESATTLKDGLGREIYRKVDENGKPVLDPDGKAVLVSPAGNGLSPEEVKALEDRYGADFRDKAALYDKQKMDSMAHSAFHAQEADFGAQNQLGTAKTNEAQAQVKWEKADDALRYAQGELATLNEKISTETEKLKVEEAKLAEERAKLAEKAKTLENEKEKLAEIEAQDKALALKQQEMNDQIKAQEKKLSDLKATQEKMKDPEYQKSIKNPEDLENALPPELRQDFVSKYPMPKQMLPDTNPAAERVVSTTPAPSSPSVSKPESGVTVASALGNGPKSLEDNGKVQTAFNTVAPNTSVVSTDPKLEEEKKLVASAPAPA